MGKDRKIIISKSILREEKIKMLSPASKYLLLVFAMEIDEYSMIYFPGWKAKEYGMGTDSFYKSVNALKKSGFVEQIEGVQSRYRLLHGLKGEK